MKSLPFRVGPLSSAGMNSELDFDRIIKEIKRALNFR